MKNLNGNLQLFANNNFGNKDLCGDLLYSRLENAINYKVDGKYSFLAIQDGYRFSWSQTSLPTGSTAPTGYTLIENSYSPGSPILGYKSGGLQLLGSLAFAKFYNVDAPTNWFGACGANTAWNDAIPGFGNSTSAVFTKSGGCLPEDFLALYVKVSDVFSIKNSDIFCDNMIEY